MTATGRVLGTTDYVAPEQAMGQSVDPRCDIYSLGVVLYEMLVGQVPFHADSQVGVAMKHVNEELPDVQRRRPEVSAALALVVERATAKRPDDRYQQIGEMIDDLSTALEVEAARAGTTTGEATSVLDAVPPPRRKLSSRARWSWATILALVVVAGGALVAVQLISSGNLGGGGAERGGGRPIEIVGATDYDPEGDGEESPNTVSLAVDGDPTGTSWATERYESETFAGTKSGPDPGVGLYVTTKVPARPTKMLVRTPTPGWDAQVFASSGEPPSGILGWGQQVGEVNDAAGVQEIDLSLQGAARHFLLWFKKASPAPEQSGGFLVEISDIKLLR
jgi:eukaryotic-like serine/threonine-protein kinase